MSERRCYVVHPVETDGKDWQWVYEDLIAQVAEGKNYTCELGRQMGAPGVHLDSILEKLLEADLVVMDITNVRDVRVFYLLGIRHAQASQSILIADIHAEILQEFRPYVIPYSDRAPGMREFRQRFGEAFDHIDEHPGDSHNPVQAYSQRARQSADLRATVATLEGEVQELPRLLRGGSNAQQASGPSRISFKRITP